jgi:NAD(P)-dependent dehydrogenase (short-subunit alcohol dehydrogenase family)
MAEHPAVDVDDGAGDVRSIVGCKPCDCGGGLRGLAQAAYAASKAAIVGLTRDLAQQWTGRKGIRVNALAPGFFESEMTEQYPDGYLEAMMHRVPARRKGDPRELVAAAIFLSSRAGGYVTGAVLPVDGGMLTS